MSDNLIMAYKFILSIQVKIQDVDVKKKRSQKIKILNRTSFFSDLSFLLAS